MALPPSGTPNGQERPLWGQTGHGWTPRPFAEAVLRWEVSMSLCFRLNKRGKVRGPTSECTQRACGECGRDRALAMSATPLSVSSEPGHGALGPSVPWD